MGSLTIMVILAIIVMITIGLSVRIVPQGEKYVVQRLGKYHGTLTPGLNLLIPYIDLVAFKVSTKDIVLDIPSQEVITHDNAVIIANAVAYINIVNPAEAVYGVEDYELAIRNLIQTALRSIIGEMSLDDALSSRNFIKAKLKEGISDDIAGWGIILKTVEIQDIKPSITMQQAMEEQAAAERERRAAVTKAEGEKQAAILEAEGRLEASKRDAQAQIELAKGQRQAINEVSSALADKGDLPVVYLLGEKYIQSLETLSKSDNNKTLVMPSDIMTTVKGLLNRG